MPKRERLQKPTPEHMRSMIRTLLANLIGDQTRIFEMIAVLEPNQIPQDMPTEKAILEALWICARSQPELAPTKENITYGLTTKTAGAGPFLDEMLLLRTDPPNVKGLSTFINDWLNEQAVIVAFKEAASIIETPMGDMTDRIARAQMEIASIAAFGDHSTRLTELERHRLTLDVLRERHRKYLLGLSIGPQFPWEAQREIVPVLKQGEVCLWTGFTGTGKSTLATAHAEYNAEYLGHIVLLLHLETTEISLQERQWSRYLKIPKRNFELGLIDPDEEPYKNWFDIFERMIDDRLSQGGGQIIYIRCAGWSTHQIRQAVTMAKTLADSQGKDLEVIIDYLGKIQRPSGKDEREGLAQVANEIKDIAETTNSHITLLAQTSPDGENAYGSGVPKQAAQVMLTIERERATVNQPRMLDDGSFMKDALGNDRYWHLRNQWSSETVLRTLKNNDGTEGYINLVIENGLGIIKEGEPAT